MGIGQKTTQAHTTGCMCRFLRGCLFCHGKETDLGGQVTGGGSGTKFEVVSLEVDLQCGALDDVGAGLHAFVVSNNILFVRHATPPKNLLKCKMHRPGGNALSRRMVAPKAGGHNTRQGAVYA
jgi:hypothetical protein